MKKIALVTGGTRGIGKAISVELVNNGYQVFAVYANNHEAAKQLKDQFGINVTSCDVSDYHQCEQVVAEIKKQCGHYVSVLVNNAGITRDRMFHKMSISEWNDVISTNLNSVFNMTKAVIEDMRENCFGRIINMSSVNGIKGQIGQVNYSAAKAGIIGFTKALAQEVANKGITVNAIAPGYIDTEMTTCIKQEIRGSITKTIPVGRFGHVEEIANTVLFLLNEKSSFITGSTLNINGGQYL